MISLKINKCLIRKAGGSQSLQNTANYVSCGVFSSSFPMQTSARSWDLEQHNERCLWGSLRFIHCRSVQLFQFQADVWDITVSSVKFQIWLSFTTLLSLLFISVSLENFKSIFLILSPAPSVHDSEAAGGAQADLWQTPFGMTAQLTIPIY